MSAAISSVRLGTSVSLTKTRTNSPISRHSRSRRRRLNRTSSVEPTAAVNPVVTWSFSSRRRASLTMRCARSRASARWSSWANAGDPQTATARKAMAAQAEAVATASTDLVALDRGSIERQAQARLLRHHELATLDRGGALEEPERPRHVLDRQAVWYGGDEVHVELGQEMA